MLKLCKSIPETSWGIRQKSCSLQGQNCSTTSQVLLPPCEKKVLGVDEGVNNPFCPGAGGWKDSGQRMTPDVGLEGFHFLLSAKWKRGGGGGGEERLIPVWDCLQVQGSWGPTQRIGTHPMGTGREMMLENNLEYHAKCLDCVMLSAVGNPMVFKWGLDW